MVRSTAGCPGGAGRQRPAAVLPAAVRGVRGWVGVYLDVPGIDWDEIAELVAEAYRTVAPKKLVALLDAQQPDRTS